LEEVSLGWRSHFAAVLGVSRSHYYHKPIRRSERDQADIQLLQAAHQEHPYYGVRRLAIYLDWSKNKTRRLRTKAGIIVLHSAKRRRVRSVMGEIEPTINAISQYAVLRNPESPDKGLSYQPMTKQNIWVQDFSYLWFARCWHYLALVVQLKTRQIIGWCLGMRHNSDLTFTALINALNNHEAPDILHNDQGNEYLSYRNIELCQQRGIILSCSNKSSPWENGFMERVFATIKLELGPLTQYADLGLLYEAIALTIHYYNNTRIHTAFNMSPNDYAKHLHKLETTCS